MSRRRHQPSGPGIGECRLRLVGGQAARAAPELIGMDVERRGQPRVGRLGQHPGDVVERRDPVKAEVPPAGVDGRVEHARQTGFRLLVGHVRAVPAVLAPDERIGPGANRLRVGWQVDPRAVAAHLVDVHVRLRDPVAVQDLGQVLRLDQVGHEPVAVVVVARVPVIQPRQVRALVFGAQRLLVPVGDHDLAIRIQAGHHQVHDVVQDPLRLLVGAGQQVVGQLRRHLRAADLVRVHAHRHDDDRPALGHQRVDLLSRRARAGR